MTMTPEEALKHAFMAGCGYAPGDPISLRNARRWEGVLAEFREKGLLQELEKAVERYLGSEGDDRRL